MARSKDGQGAASTAKATPETQKQEAAAPAAPAAPEPKAPGLLIVTEGFTLLWPIAGLPPRGAQGTVVREDDPFLDRNGICPDQRYKLRPAVDGETHLPLTPCNNRIVAEMLRERGIEWLPLIPALVPAPPKPPPTTDEVRDFEVPDIDEPMEGLEP